MKSFKELLNEYSNSSSFRRISEEELIALKRCVLDIYIKVAELCERNNLILMLGGGSVLGAVRHKGFIPWDDDMDLNMFREDYNKLLKLCEEGALGENYEYTFPSKKHDAPNAFLKIYRKNSKLVGYRGELSHYPMGVSIDVFPIEYAPTNVIVRRCKGVIANCIRLVANLSRESEELKTLKDSLPYRNKLFWYVLARYILGRSFTFVSHKQWVLLFDTFVQSNKISKLVVAPTGRKLYNGEIYPYEVFYPVKKGIFEGISVNLPSDTDYYLKNMFGDYMKIPPVEKRESHMIKELHLPAEYM